MKAVSVFAGLFLLFTVSSAEETCASSKEAATSEDGESDNCNVANVVPNAVGFDFFLRVDKLEARAKKFEKNQEFRKDYGITKGKEGQRVVYLQNSVLANDPELVEDLWSLTEGADVWGSMRNTQAPRLALRSLKVIEYQDSDDTVINYHNDGTTYLTVAVMLNKPGVDFQGGTLEIQENFKGKCKTELNAQHGSLVVWRGWLPHRVTATTSGKRRVLVAEWWNDEYDNTAFGRPQDTLIGVLAALKLDQSSTELHSLAGQFYSFADKPRDAEMHLKAAVYLDESNAKACALLGKEVLTHTMDFDEAVKWTKASLALEPNAENYVFLAKLYELLGELPSAATALKSAVAIDPMHKKELERMEGKAENLVYY